MSRLRALLYVALMTATVVPWALVVLAAWLRPPEVRYRLAVMWVRLAILMARWLCGVRWRVEGEQHLPEQPVIVLAKHQSTWEAFWLPSFLPRRMSFVYKRELHWIPFFGWAVASAGMINIDRARGGDAFEQMLAQGERLLRDGWWIVIFPEGTRTAPGARPRYKTGGARLAVRTGVPVLPIAVDSGEVWPRGLLIRRAGEITVSIGAPIATRGKSVEQVAAEAERWIEGEMRRLAPHRYREAAPSPAPVAGREAA